MTSQVEEDVANRRDVSYGRLDLPLLSVIVICYNHAPFLDKCLESIIQQTYAPIELIIVDNCSTDNSRQVIEQFCATPAANRRGVRIEPVFSETNDREMGAMLQGFAKSRGRYICFIDGDDWWLPQCLEAHIKAHLVSRIAVGVTSVDMYQSADDEIVVGTGKRVSDFVMANRDQRRDFVRMESLAAFDFPSSAARWDLRADDLHLVPPSMAQHWCWSPTSGLCFRREAVELMFNPTPTLRDGADGFLVRGIACLTGGIIIDKSLAVYRTHGNNLFTKHPALENILQHKRDQCDGLDMDICLAVLRCFHEQMAVLAQNLEVVDIYINAVETLDKVALHRNAGGFSSFTARFLLENKKAIIQHFGLDTYLWWSSRYITRKDTLNRALKRIG